MDMALSPIPAESGQSLELTATQQTQLKLAYLMADGNSYRELAMRAAKGDKRRAAQLRHKWRRWAAEDQFFQSALAMATQAEMSMGLPLAGKALVRRASRGYPPAIKILFEATGFHNPKMQHEHSGEVKITMSVAGSATGLPRPPRTEDIVDADVVEE